MSKTVPLFCFPDIETQQKHFKLSSETFSFVLTDTDSTKKYGYCRRMLPPGSGRRYAEVFCIVSKFPSLFQQILDVMEQRRLVSSVEVFTFLKRILVFAPPTPGATLKVDCLSAKTGTMEDYYLSRPDEGDLLRDHVNFHPLYDLLGGKLILQLFAALMGERRIIFTSSSLARLSTCTLAALALLYPFSWQHVFIPVVPRSLLDYCCAPMPFLVGVLSSFMPQLSQMPLEEVVIVYLDEKKISDGGSEIVQIPNPTRDKMYQQIKLLKKSFDHMAFAEIFFRFNVSVFGKYKSFLRGSPLRLDREAFFASLAPYKEFVEVVQGCQLCEQWIVQCETLSNNTLAPASRESVSVCVAGAGGMFEVEAMWIHTTGKPSWAQSLSLPTTILLPSRLIIKLL
eukprot:TRINITY_DN1146_c0_g1_i3.p1 TRINITY_DN1146_c0_g1~~TRINITY_DN1146_c0_g1_i3.p1  ORF type:complete len:397 (-),score=109.08 TRINITY_DN1146_c0_g1_i3:1401-2591(-)